METDRYLNVWHGQHAGKLCAAERAVVAELGSLLRALEVKEVVADAPGLTIGEDGDGLKRGNEGMGR